MLTRLRMLTAGESHGPALVGILDGLPRGLTIARGAIAAQLRRRRVVAGRSARQQIENDDVRVLSGLRAGVTLGSPVALVLDNQDHARWRGVMSVWPEDAGDAGAPATTQASAPVTVPRPGHADLAGHMKLGAEDLRDVIERASARETAMRTALGALAHALLEQVGVRVTSYVEQLGPVRATPQVLSTDAIAARADASSVRALDADAEARMLEAIEQARRTGDTLGGTFVVVADGMPGGVGSFFQADQRLSARLCEAVASIHGVKAAGVGDAWALGEAPGRTAHDVVMLEGDRLVRPTNRAGGVEGGITNGAPVIVRGVQKPLATLAGGLPSVDLHAREPARGHVERTDTCAVPAAAVVAEAVVALVLADALLVAFGGDTLEELRARVEERRSRAR